MKRNTIIKSLVSEGFRRETLSLFNDKQLVTLYKKIVTEQSEEDKKVDVEVDQKKADDVIKRVDPKKVDTVKIDATEEEVTEGGWDTKKVAKLHKVVKSSNNKLRAAQTRKGDEWVAADNKEDKEKRSQRHKAKKEAKKKSEVKESTCTTCKKIKCECRGGLSENNFVSFGKKKDIMEMIQRKLAEQASPTIAPTKPKVRPDVKPTTKPKPKTPFRPNPGTDPRPKAEKLPEFLSFDAIFGNHKEFASPATPTTKPKTRPTTKPTTKPKPKTPFRPNPGTDPKPKALKNYKK